jgi:hypothetical protein
VIGLRKESNRSTIEELKLSSPSGSNFLEINLEPIARYQLDRTPTLSAAIAWQHPSSAQKQDK